MSTETTDLDLAEVPADQVGDQAPDDEAMPAWDGIDESTAEQEGTDQ